MEEVLSCKVKEGCTLTSLFLLLYFYKNGTKCVGTINKYVNKNKGFFIDKSSLLS